jgi:hypothetical protein
MTTREIINAALLWHAAHERRRAIGAEKRQLDKALKEDQRGMFHTLDQRIAAGDLAARLTPAKQRELNALRKLAKVCQQHRDQLGRADVIDVEVKQLASASTVSTSPERNQP